MTASDLGIKLIIGLGNPGEKYKNTYHNIGVLFLDFLIKKSAGVKFAAEGAANEQWQEVKSKKFGFQKIGNFAFIKSSTFMNESGQAAISAMRYFKACPKEILVIHDDADILLGKYKLSFNSRSAGHKGIDSIIKEIKTLNFYRLRVGVRKKTVAPKTTGREKAGLIVLKPISKQNFFVLNDLFEKIIAELFPR